ncbi:MAG: hypothetical protein RR495_06295 [Anaerovoracaceae bacterium]
MKMRKKAAIILSLTLVLSVSASGFANASNDLQPQKEKPFSKTSQNKFDISQKNEVFTPISSGGELKVKTFYSVAAQGETRTSDYFKYVANVDGLVSLTGPVGFITLCDENKTPYSATGGDFVDFVSEPTESEDFRTISYGVKKGSTYWFHVEDIDHKSETGKYVYYLGIVEKAIKEKSGKSKKSSVSIKKNSPVYGVIPADEQDFDFYKFNTTKKTNSIYFESVTNEFLRVEIYHKYKGGVYKRMLVTQRMSPFVKLKVSGDNGKGTYYVKVFNSNQSSSGIYQLYWK